MFTKKILAAAITSQPSANGVADAIDFDGTNDYLSRSSDLVGNADGKTFTLSAWVWNAGDYGCIYSNNDQFGDSYGITIRFDATSLYIFGGTSGGGAVLSWFTSNFVPKYTWFHVLISIDLANPANRFVFINDVSVSSTPSTYANSNIDFTRAQHNIGRNPYGSYLNRQRFSNIFLDYTYRDLSVEANRRLFITADRKPAANQAALNPILYLPLNDHTQPGKNLGTGGDFALNGVVARSGRGPSQFNAPYSDLDGSADFLSRTSLTGIVDGKQFTFCCVFNSDATGPALVSFASGANGRFAVRTNGGRLQFIAADSGNTFILNATVAPSDAVAVGRTYVVLASIDLANTSNRKIFINGVDKTSSTTWTTYTNTNINFAIGTSPTYQIAASVSTPTFNGRLGNVFFDTRYIDLSQPANLAKFVTGTGIDAKPADLGANGEKPFGTPPLIYLPMYGNNAGKNYGTGGDFTVNSGPFAGARGPNEFWGNKADFDGSTGYLARASALTGVSDSKTFSASFFVSFDVARGDEILTISNSGGQNRLRIIRSGAYKLYIQAYNASNTEVLVSTSTFAFSENTLYHVCLCIDLNNTSNRYVYINAAPDTTSWTTYTNSPISFSDGARPAVGVDWNGSVYGQSFDGKLSELYFTTDYIDFSQEANRLKFRDAFGNAVDLAPQIAAGTLPNPAIYMRFDPANFGKNSGTGGDFVVNGTITDGGQL